jgi:uncharacterized membrane protein
LLIQYDKFNLRIAQVIRLSVAIAMIILVAALIMILLKSPHSRNVALVGLCLIVLAPVNGILAVALRSFNKKRWSQFTMTIIIIIIYITAILLAL